MSRGSRQKFESLAKMLRHILTVAPDEYGLALDSDGWIPVKALLQSLQEEEGWKGTTITRILDLSWELEDCPFEFSEERIRCRPSVLSDQLPPERLPFPPPRVLYYGCKSRAYPHIRKNGLQPMEGGEIILSRTREMALRIGKRRDPKPILAEIQTVIAEAMAARFLSYGNQLFCVDHIPPEAISGPPPEELSQEERMKRLQKAKQQKAAYQENIRSLAWNPAEDHLLSRDQEQLKRKSQEARDHKRISWKDAAHHDSRRHKDDMER